MLNSIIIGVIIILVIYLIYVLFFRNKTERVLSGRTNAKHETHIKRHKMGKYSSSYSFSIWFAIDDWNYRLDEPKIIFTRVDSTGNVGPEVALHRINNTISVGMSTYEGDTQKCHLYNVPIQKWVNLIVVLNNRALDLYLDGKLVRTCVLDGVPKLNNKARVFLTPGGGFSGATSNFRYFTYPLNPRQAYEIYREGYSGSWTGILDKYRVKLAFMKDNHEVGSLEI